MEKGRRTRARIVSPFFTNQRLEMRFDSDLYFFFYKSLYRSTESRNLQSIFALNVNADSAFYTF